MEVPNEKALASDGVFDQLQKHIEFVKDSFQELVSKNAKLQEELNEAQTREAKLLTRNKELQDRIATLKIHHQRKNTLQINETKEIVAFEDGFVEQMIRRIQEEASHHSTVPLQEFQRLHSAYLKIKKLSRKLEAKYLTAEHDRTYLKETLIKCYNSSSRACQEYLDQRWKERKASRAKAKAVQKARLPKDDELSSQKSSKTQQTESLPDRVLSLDKSPAIEKRKSAKGGDAVDNSGPLPSDKSANNQEPRSSDKSPAINKKRSTKGGDAVNNRKPLSSDKSPAINKKRSTKGGDAVNNTKPQSSDKSPAIEERTSAKGGDAANKSEPLPSDKSPAIEERKSAKDGDAVNNQGSEEEKETLSVSKIANSDCVDSRDDEKDYKKGSCVYDLRISSKEQRIKTSDSRFQWEDDHGPNCTFMEYFSELMTYKNAIGNFDVLPDHATMAHVGKFVAFVRAEHDKYRKGDEASITVEEIEQLKSVDFDWEDKGLCKLRKRRRSSRSSGATPEKRPKTNGFVPKRNGISNDHVEL